MTETTLTSRLRRVEGQIRGLQRMLNENSSCEEVLTQLIAARSALDQVGLLIMNNYLDNCLLQGDEPEIRENIRRMFNLILARYSVAVPSEEFPSSSL